MRYTEARLSPVAAMMLDDLELDTVDFVATYDERRQEPTVLPSKFPNLLVNGATGIAVGMATSIPPHNAGRDLRGADPRDRRSRGHDRRTDGDRRGAGLPHRRHHLRAERHSARLPHGPRHDRAAGPGHASKRWQGALRGSSSAKSPTSSSATGWSSASPRWSTSDKIKGISGIRDESDLKEPVRLIVELKRDADPEVVLNQLYQFSPLQDTVLDHLPGAGRRQAADAELQGAAAGVHPSSRHGHPPADRSSC